MLCPRGQRATCTTKPFPHTPLSMSEEGEEAGVEWWWWGGANVNGRSNVNYLSASQSTRISHRRNARSDASRVFLSPNHHQVL